MRELADILLRPIVSEKGYAQQEQGKYGFEVLRKATKTEIKQAVEKMFSVHVQKVNVINVLGKRRRMRNREGYTPDRRKAIVTLNAGEHIQFFEKV